MLRILESGTQVSGTPRKEARLPVWRACGCQRQHSAMKQARPLGGAGVHAAWDLGEMRQGRHKHQPSAAYPSCSLSNTESRPRSHGADSEAAVDSIALKQSSSHTQVLTLSTPHRGACVVVHALSLILMILHETPQNQMNHPVCTPSKRSHEILCRAFMFVKRLSADDSASQKQKQLFSSAGCWTYAKNSRPDPQTMS